MDSYIEGRHGAGDEDTGSDLRAMAKKITWWQAAEILGFSDRHLRRIRERYQEFGYDGLFDLAWANLSPSRISECGPSQLADMVWLR